jgi:hypothetical protein
MQYVVCCLTDAICNMTLYTVLNVCCLTDNTMQYDFLSLFVVIFVCCYILYIITGLVRM